MSDQLRYPLIRRYVMETPWAILPSKMEDIMEFLAFKAQGGVLTAEEIHERLGAAAQRQRPRSTGEVAVLPIHGTLAHRMDLLSAASGGTSVEAVSKEFHALVADSSVSSIILDIDSPGGAVSGIEEFATQIYKARGRKPITAVANTMAASAAYWIGTAADEFVVSPSAQVGSIGVIGGHEDRSAMYEKLGVKVSLISAGKYKAENNPFEPLTEEGQAALQKRVDESYGMFVRAVAKHRGVSVDAVRNGFGEGRVVGAKEAVSLGMADRIATIDEVIARRPKPTESDVATVNAELVAVSYEDHGRRVAADLDLFIQATRDRIIYRRVDQGRKVLSDPQRERLAQTRALIQQADAELATLLAETNPDRDAVARTQNLQQLRRHLVDVDVALVGGAD